MLDETGADGFVPARTLGSERFEFYEAKHALIGVQHGGAYRLGQTVRVRLMEAAPLRGGLTFEMISDPIEDPDFVPSKRPRTFRGAKPKGRAKNAARSGKDKRKRR
jgi:ribonuclease R